MYYTAELYMDGTSETTIREMQHAIGQRVGRPWAKRLGHGRPTEATCVVAQRTIT